MSDSADGRPASMTDPQMDAATETRPDRGPDHGQFLVVAVHSPSASPPSVFKKQSSRAAFVSGHAQHLWNARET